MVVAARSAIGAARRLLACFDPRVEPTKVPAQRRYLVWDDARGMGRPDYAWFSCNLMTEIANRLETAAGTNGPGTQSMPFWVVVEVPKVALASARRAKGKWPSIALLADRWKSLETLILS